MTSRRKRLKESALYVIIDKDVCQKKIINIARAAINSGADIIQLRCKNSSAREVLRYAKTLRGLTKGKSLFIINDHIDFALACGADGVHLGQDDLPADIARRIVGRKILIGVSCHNLKQAKLAEDNGADYVAIGPVFSTLTKPKEKPITTKVLSILKKNIKIPFFPIGGINQKNFKEILRYKIKRIAVIRAVCESKNIKKAVQGFKLSLN